MVPTRTIQGRTDMKAAALCAGLAALLLGTATAQAQLSGDKVKIGVLNDRTGTYADISGEGSVVAARMAAEEVGNKVAGKPIEIVAADHQNKPDIGANI